ncbi:UDP-N-acetylglucosamine 3-dehydrogenase [Steroidobacter agaridevorans]|uniref:UDP-N-acetylglucosamine 3-dehydrogenase n=1 Tax=Steroidobacter agaridevorans TaxID=2695856 RepID=A0A829YI61_9GAMM|nr:Gfo/Idh/MocA family oxidoreductase [Steroidobacter agaridevorans]GFE82563.1 UDP-N-acetylglucosamine 3-dehydrogenase [Steroidobacter agaridevorans]GFE85120.1 UDP-N-acetylglucosamine 3-dehydrogenase [Steroidobacter agaridevorans]
MSEATHAAPLRTAVIGVGYLGRFHAQKYAQIAGSKLVAVVDANAEACAKVAAELGTKAVPDYRELFGAVDAVSLAVPTPLHHAIGCELLKNGIDVLIEKPIATSVAEARELVDLARTHKRILQVGHLERFNPAVLAAAERLQTPRFVESHRLAPFKQRGTDVSVVLDLMIHDIDLIQELVGTPIEHIDAVGATVFSGEIDIVNARLRFQGGCVVNTTASRISLKQERKIRIFQDDAYLSVDMQQKILTVIRKKDAAPVESPAQVSIEEQNFDQGDALLAEIEAFLKAVRERSKPVVTGEDGLRALETAMKITALVQPKVS